MNEHNRYCKKCYSRTVYLTHINDIPWSTCEVCKRELHLHETIGEPRLMKNKDIARNKRIELLTNNR